MYGILPKVVELSISNNKVTNPFCHVHSNVMLGFKVPALQDPPLCSITIKTSLIGSILRANQSGGRRLTGRPMRKYLCPADDRLWIATWWGTGEDHGGTHSHVHVRGQAPEVAVKIWRKTKNRVKEQIITFYIVQKTKTIHIIIITFCNKLYS